MNYYIYASTIIFAFLALIWNSKNWVNFSIKAILFGMTMFGAAVSLQLLGYIVKA